MTATKYKLERSIKITLQPSAECNEDPEVCDWRFPESRLTRDAAKDHVRKTGHRVSIKTETYETWEAV